MQYLELVCDRLDDARAQLEYEMTNPVDAELYGALDDVLTSVSQGLERLTTIRQAMEPDEPQEQEHDDS